MRNVLFPARKSRPAAEADKQAVADFLETARVLSGVTIREECETYPCRPRLMLNGVEDIPG